ncbi:MAG: hypothetical protein EXS59_01710 [Candidatus Taylorbacteria bacterium]|nr:hypothetical protein [Candidatus Taylorbacteria bacterium]
MVAANSGPEQNPLAALDSGTVDFLRSLYETVTHPRPEAERHADQRVEGAMCLIKTLEDHSRLPKNFDTQQYLKLIERVGALEDKLARSSPSMVAEEAGLVLRGDFEGAKELPKLKAEIAILDAALEPALGLHPVEAVALVNSKNFGDNVKGT